MNDELSPFMTTTFPTVELCFHSGALYLKFLPEQSRLFTERTQI